MSETIRLFAGDCTTTFEGARTRTQRGHVAVVVKPDRTVLVHDADGYQPVTWLTRPDSLTVETDSSGFGLVARADEQVLRVVSNGESDWVEYPITEAGVPVGSHPETGDPLVRASGAVRGLDSDVTPDATRIPTVTPPSPSPRASPPPTAPVACRSSRLRAAGGVSTRRVRSPRTDTRGRRLR